MLVTLAEILRPADSYAVIAPDFLTAGMLRHYLAAAERYQAPLIASYPPLPLDSFRHFRRWTAKLRSLCEDTAIPICLHLDHGRDVTTCIKAIEAGFTSVMIDASSHSLEQNLNMTAAVVRAAQRAGVSVEAEIGHVGSNRSGLEGRSDASRLTDPDQARYFAAETAIDALAVSVGTSHGQYRGTPKIDFERLEMIRAAVDIPLVLHGASGTGTDNLRQAVDCGIRKINIFTDIIRPYLRAARPGLNPFRSGNTRQIRVVDEVLGHYFKLSGSIGRGPDSCV